MQIPDCILCGNAMTLADSKVRLWKCTKHSVFYSGKDHNYFSEKRCPKCSLPFAVKFYELECPFCARIEEIDSRSDFWAY